MSNIPRSKQFTVSLKHGVQKQNQTVNVNIGKLDDHEHGNETHAKYPVSEQNPYVDLAVENYTDNEVACKLAKKYNEILVKKDKRICGLEFILNIVENNPFCELGKIIPHINDLQHLIRLLTNSDDVEIIPYEISFGCCCAGYDFTEIDKIFIRKDGKLLHFETSFIEVSRILDIHKINYKRVLVS